MKSRRNYKSIVQECAVSSKKVHEKNISVEKSNEGALKATSFVCTPDWFTFYLSPAEVISFLFGLSSQDF